MSSIICKIQSISSPAPVQAVMLTQSLMKVWGCQHGQSIKISVGNKTLIARVLGIRRGGHTIYLHRTIISQLAIPYTKETRASFRQKELRLGPVLGILTTGYTGSPSAPFGLRSNLFRNFLLAAHEDKPFFYVFTPEMVDWINRTVTGWFYLRNNKGSYHWIRHIAPLPEVVYERIPNRKAESLPQVKECRNRLTQITQAKIFNQGFFNKWSVHEMLYNQPLTSEHIPEAFPSPTVDIIRQMLDRHQMVYLKPIAGSLGLGIFRITRHPDGGYFCRFRGGNRNILRRFDSLESMLRHHFGPQMNRLPRYLIQQGIRLIKYNGRPVDFRVHMHKDSLGSWQVVGIGAKVAGIGSVTTHGRTGGSLLSVSDIFQTGEKLEMEKRIKDAAIRIATTMEEAVQGPLGELGMDIGVDHYHKVWLFEVNSKPGRHIFIHPSLRDAGKQSARYITKYSLKLAQFV